MSYANNGVQMLVGWTNPNDFYPDMKKTDATARIFNDDVRNFVKDEPFKNAWNTWYPRWREFFDSKNYAGVSMDLLRTDATVAQYQEYKQDLARFQTTYQGLKSDGKPLPSNAPIVPITPVPGEAKKQDGIPLWWFLAGIAVIGTGVFIYYRLKKASRMLEARENFLVNDAVPFITKPLGSLSKPFAQAVAVRDAEVLPALPAPACGECARDLEVTPVPRAATKYFLSGS